MVLDQKHYTCGRSVHRVLLKHSVQVLHIPFARALPPRNMSGKAIRSSYTIDGLLGLNQQDEHKHPAKPERVIDEATHKSDRSTRHDREQGTVSLLRCFTALLTRLAPRTLRYFTNKLESEQGVQHIFTCQNFVLAAGGILPP